MLKKSNKIYGFTEHHHNTQHTLRAYCSTSMTFKSHTKSIKHIWMLKTTAFKKETCQDSVW